MTREVALRKVRGYLTNYFSITDYNDVEEIMLALEQQPCEDVFDEIIAQIEQTRDKDKIAEYPYNRCIRIVEEYKNGE